MKTDIDLFDAADASPFDAIRRTRPDGTEYWSARDLMVAVNYDKWERFAGAIERAEIAAANQGHDVATAFSRSREEGTGGRPREDVHLTRFAAYLVVMNGDPRKPEVAAAQQYFAIRTREAETAPTTLPRGEALLALAVVEAQRVLAEKDQQIAQLEGPAAQAETYRRAEGARTIGSIANDFKTYAKSRFPGVKILHQDVFDHAGRLGLIIRGNTIRNNEPTGRAIEAGWALPSRFTYATRTRGDQTGVTARLTPRGEARLWDGLCKFISEHGSLEMRSMPANRNVQQALEVTTGAARPEIER